MPKITKKRKYLKKKITKKKLLKRNYIKKRTRLRGGAALLSGTLGQTRLQKIQKKEFDERKESLKKYANLKKMSAFLLDKIENTTDDATLNSIELEIEFQVRKENLKKYVKSLSISDPQNVFQSIETAQNEIELRKIKIENNDLVDLYDNKFNITLLGDVFRNITIISINGNTIKEENLINKHTPTEFLKSMKSYYIVKIHFYSNIGGFSIPTSLTEIASPIIKLLRHSYTESRRSFQKIKFICENVYDTHCRFKVHAFVEMCKLSQLIMDKLSHKPIGSISQFKNCFYQMFVPTVELSQIVPEPEPEPEPEPKEFFNSKHEYQIIFKGKQCIPDYINQLPHWWQQNVSKKSSTNTVYAWKNNSDLISTRIDIIQNRLRDLHTENTLKNENITKLMIELEALVSEKDRLLRQNKSNNSSDSSNSSKVITIISHFYLSDLFSIPTQFSGAEGESATFIQFLYARFRQGLEPCEGVGKTNCMWDTECFISFCKLSLYLMHFKKYKPIGTIQTFGNKIYQQFQMPDPDPVPSPITPPV